MKISHISSVHSAGDPRVRLKEARYTALSFDNVGFVTADNAAERLTGDPSGLTIIKVNSSRNNRLVRFFFTSPLCMYRAYRLGADVFHIHDPELVPYAWILSLTGRDVIYDIHEDYVTSVSQKQYIPKFFRKSLAKLVGIIESLATRRFHRVIAEKYYKNRFPEALQVLNYPILRDLLPVTAFSPSSTKVLYTGNVTPDRGAMIMAEFHANSDKYSINLVGRCAPHLSDKINEVCAGKGVDKPPITGVGHFVDFSQIIAAYAESQWLAGIAVFPDTGHYREKELTKFFEYMAVGLPIIASDFPVWRALIEDQGVGICVPPGDNQAIENALDWLGANPEEALAMSQRGKELAKTKYSWESQADKLIALYEDILSQKKKRRSM